MSKLRSAKRRRAKLTKERRVEPDDLGLGVFLETMRAREGEPIAGAVIFVLTATHVERLCISTSNATKPTMDGFAAFIDSLTAQQLRAIEKGKGQ